MVRLVHQLVMVLLLVAPHQVADFLCPRGWAVAKRPAPFQALVTAFNKVQGRVVCRSVNTFLPLRLKVFACAAIAVQATYRGVHGALQDHSFRREQQVRVVSPVHAVYSSAPPLYTHHSREHCTALAFAI